MEINIDGFHYDWLWRNCEEIRYRKLSFLRRISKFVNISFATSFEIKSDIFVCMEIPLMDLIIVTIVKRLDFSIGIINLKNPALRFLRFYVSTSH